MTKQDATVVASYYRHIREDALAAVPTKAGGVLDLGGGVGATSAALKRRSQASHVVVADLVADDALPEIDQAFVGDLEDPAFLAKVLEQEGPFDTILCLDVLEHLRDPWAVVARLTHGLAPGGVMVASIPNARNIALVWPLVVYGRFDLTDAGLCDRTHLRWFTRQSAIMLMTSSGLEVELVVDKLREARRYRWANALTLGLFRRFLEIQYIIRARRSG